MLEKHFSNLTIYTEYMAKKKKQAVPRWKKLLVAALGAATIGGGVLTAGNLTYFKGEKVIRVLDGDTFLLESYQPIRLYGIDAPELGNCMSEDAKNALTKLIQGKRVQVREPIAEGNRRIMALVYSDKLLINEVMLRAGLAQYLGEGGSQMARLRAANDYARTNHVGIYSPLCYQPDPPNPACAIKGNDDIRQNKKFYYLPDCPYYTKVVVMKFQGDAWFCTETEAKKAGFTKSDTCN